VSSNKQAATLTAAVMGVAKLLALRLPPDVMFGDTGVDSLMSLLRSRFGDAGGTTSNVAIDGLRSCTRGNSTMEEHLVSFDEAVALCEEADCTLSDAMQTHVVVDQANLASAEQSMALSTASTGTDAPVTYLAITRALLLLNGGKAKKTDVALLAQPRPSRAPHPPRKQHRGGEEIQAAGRRPRAPARKTSGLSSHVETYFQYFTYFKHHFARGMFPSCLAVLVLHPLQWPPCLYWKLRARRST